MLEANLRTGRPVEELRAESISTLTELIEETSHEKLIEAASARSMLEPDEMQRVRDFVDDGLPSRRSLLSGFVDTDQFLDSFLLLDNSESQELITRGRSLRDVILRIRQLGGLDAAADRIPWLQRAVPLARSLDFDRLQRRRIFVRRAASWEAATSWCQGQGLYIEEGQHRAIAIAWNLTSGSHGEATDGAAVHRIHYLRGVNRLGHESGHAFWAVTAWQGPWSQPRPCFSTAQLVGGMVVCLLARYALARASSPTRPVHRRRKGSR